MEACIIVTYRCNARCYMCNTWQYPTKRGSEITPEVVSKIPSGLKFINITGGEPFLREDLSEIVRVALTRTERLVISTNGYFTERMIQLAQRYGNKVGFRISIEGLPASNDLLRGIKDGFDHGMRSLLSLQEMGIKDIGFGITASDRNARDMVELWHLAKGLGLEFATATTHSSYYFHKHDNGYEDPEMVAGEFERIALELLKTNRPKNWFRAYFNMGLANKVRGGKRPLPCEVGSDVFFLDPFGNILPCNGSAEPLVMGNLNAQSFETIWNGPGADEVRRKVKSCSRDCWMIGSVAPAMKKRIWIPAWWAVKNRLKLVGSKNTTPSLEPVGRESRMAEARTLN